VLKSQNANPEGETLIQVSGIVADAKTLKPLPWVNVSVPARFWGTISSNTGFFTIVAAVHDTLQFSFIGYKPVAYVVPDTLKSYLASVVILLERDTVHLQEVEVYPWPTREAFKQAFLELKLEEEKLNRIEAYAGFHRLENPTPPPPTIMNPVSFFYENVVKKLKERMPKPGKVDQLPKME